MATWPSNEVALAGLAPDAAQAVAALISWAAGQGISVRITSALRTCEEQETLYAQGRTTQGKVVTNANGCHSWHVLGRAVDLYVGTWEAYAYAPLGVKWESMGGVWGGRFDDPVHFEWHVGYTIPELCQGGYSEPCQRKSRARVIVGVGIAVVGLVAAISMAGKW